MNCQAIQIVDLGFGDSGKGTMVDYLVRRHGIEFVIRFNGGPQAGHNVVLPDGRHHTFAQFGSGSFVPGVRTFLSRFMLIEPYALLNEASHLRDIGIHDALSRTTIDAQCRVITPPQQIANRIRERFRGAAAHGTCGLGIGECVADSIEQPELSVIASDLPHRDRVRRKLQSMLEYKRAELAPFRSIATLDEIRLLDRTEWIDTAIDLYRDVARHATIVDENQSARRIRDCGSMIFEGAQGVLLDERYGFHPHTTWSTTTFANADMLLSESGADAPPRRIGITRTYLTRHGNGPFPTADDKMDQDLAEPHNLDSGWQGRFRRGALDLVLLRYALDVCGGVDGLAVTHLDAFPRLPSHVCSAYQFDGDRWERIPFKSNPTLAEREQLAKKMPAAQPEYSAMNTSATQAYLDDLQRQLETPVLHRSLGPTFLDKA